MLNWFKKGAKAALEFGAEYLQDVAFVNELLEMPDAQALQHLEEKIDEMEEGVYTRFLLYLKYLIWNDQRKIQRLESSRSSNSWGNSWEDRIAQGMAELKYGSSPENSQEVQELELRLQGIQWIYASAEQLRKTMKVNLSATQEVSSSPSLPLEEIEKPREQVVEPMQQGGIQAAFQALQKDYESEIKAGRILPERQLLLNSVIQRMGKVMQPIAEHLPLAEKVKLEAARIAQMQELMTVISGAVAAPSMLTQPTQERAKRLFELNQEIMKYIFAEAGRPPTGEESEAIGSLLASATDARNRIPELQSDAEAYLLEQESLRRFALDTRQYSLRHHLTLTFPMWSSPNVPQDPNAIFFSGGEEVQTLLSKVCSDQRLTLLRRPLGKEYAQARWEQLQASHVAIFDFTEYIQPRFDDVDLNQSAQTAAISYELGIALVLGTPIIVVAQEGRSLPFDVDIPPVILSQNKNVNEVLSEAIDIAIYGRQRESIGSSISETFAYLTEHLTERLNSNSRLLLKQIDEKDKNDPIKFRHLVQYTLKWTGREMPQALFPAMAGSYPNPDEPRCFHVTAYRPNWAKATREITSAACQKFGIHYIRGDEVLTPNVIYSIWNEICRATHVVVDLTHLTANAVLELGIAHALGRNVLLILQEEEFDKNFFSSIENHFPSIRKLRLHPYSLDDQDTARSLSQILAAFLNAQ